MNDIVYFARYLKAYRFRLILLLLMTIPLGMMDGVMAWTIKPFMDGLIAHKPVVDVLWLPVIIIGFNAVQGGLNYSATYLNAYIGQHMQVDIQRDLYNKLLTFNLHWANGVESGFVINRMFNDPKQVQEALLSNTRIAISRLVSTISIGAVMFWIYWKLSLIALGTVALVMLPIAAVRKKIISNNNLEAQDSASLISMLNSSLSGKKVINSFNLQAEMRKQFARAQRSRYDRMMSMSKAQATLSPINYVITSVGISIIILYGSHLILTHTITTGSLVAFITSLLMLYRPMRTIGHTAVTTQRLLGALARVRELLEYRQDQEPDTASLARVGPLQKQVEARNLTFCYPGREEPALKHVNLVIEKGETVALVGRSGSGKTTLAELFMGLYPLDGTQGTVCYDGLPIQTLNLVSLRQQIGYVSQDTFLFDGTLRQNIMLGKLNATPREIEDALQRANLTEFILALPDGLETRVGERGIRLSGGQRQRVAIARAFLKNASFLILDEATSALDTQSEAAVQDALDDLMENRTTLVVAHRLSTIQHADKIVVMDQGQVVEIGTHESLLAQGGYYSNLFMAQYTFQQEESVSVPLR